MSGDLLSKAKTRKRTSRAHSKNYVWEERTFEFEGEVVTRKVKVYKELKSRPGTQMKLRGRVESDAKLVEGLSEEKITLLSKKKKKRDQKANIKKLGSLLG